MAALGYVYSLEKQTSPSSERGTNRNATSAEFLEVQTPLQVLTYDWICRCPVSSARSTQKFGGKKNMNTRILKISIKNVKGCRNVQKA